MKILLTADPEIPVPPNLYGGIERIIDVLVNGYVEKGHDVTLFAHPDSKVPCRLIKWAGLQSGGITNTLLNTKKLFSHVVDERYDIIHSFSRLAYLTPLLPSGIPKIMSYQREPTISQIKKASWLAKKDTLLFTGCSDYISNQIKPFANATTVYNCVPIERFQFSETVADDAPLCFLGRIEYIKGTHLAIEVAQKANRRLIIAGNIPQEGKAYFEEKIAPFLNEQIEYIGPVNDEQKNDLLRKSAALLMPIEWNEPFGIVMAEAMACGTPVIGFPKGSIPEVVENGVSGFVCNDIAEMIFKIEDLRSLKRYDVRREAEKRFSSTTIVDEYLEVYDNLRLNKTVSNSAAK